MDRSLVGYYDSADQTEAAYDPGDAVPCPVCGFPWSDDTVRTVSVMPFGDTRSYFYRLHRRCHDRLTVEEEQALDEAAMTAIGALGRSGGAP